MEKIVQGTGLMDVMGKAKEKARFLKLKIMYKNTVYVSIICLVLMTECFAFPCKSWYSSLEKGLGVHHPDKVPAAASSGEIAEWKFSSAGRKDEPFFPNGSEPILNLWRSRQFNFLELLWWKTRESEKRLLILSLFLGGRLEDTSAMPSFNLYYSRFEGKEAQTRKEEIDCIEKNRKKIHDLLKKHHLLNSQLPR